MIETMCWYVFEVEKESVLNGIKQALGMWNSQALIL